MAELARRACELRRLVLKMLAHAGAGHPGGSLSAADIMAALYFRVLRLDPGRPDWPDRDRFVLSKGHAATLLYAALALRGYLPVEELMTFDAIDSRLQGHPDAQRLPALEASTGSLGQGLSIAAGMALGLARRGSPARAFCLLGDGEMQEGQVWEALMFAGHHRLDRLVAVIDCNGLQLMGRTADVLPVEPLARRLEAFGWGTVEVDGHDLPALVGALEGAAGRGRPWAVIARTVKGKGVSFMEDKVEWHSRALTPDDLARALAELGGEGR
jgi:transketolase